jgi:hypothetical protein
MLRGHLRRLRRGPRGRGLWWRGLLGRRLLGNAVKDEGPLVLRVQLIIVLNEAKPLGQSALSPSHELAMPFLPGSFECSGLTYHIPRLSLLDGRWGRLLLDHRHRLDLHCPSLRHLAPPLTVPLPTEPPGPRLLPPGLCHLTPRQYRIRALFDLHFDVSLRWHGGLGPAAPLALPIQIHGHGGLHIHQCRPRFLLLQGGNDPLLFLCRVEHGALWLLFLVVARGRAGALAQSLLNLHQAIRAP